MEGGRETCCFGVSLGSADLSIYWVYRSDVMLRT